MPGVPKMPFRDFSVKAGTYADMTRGKTDTVGTDMAVRSYSSGELMFTLAKGTQNEMGIMLSRGDVQRLRKFLDW